MVPASLSVAQMLVVAKLLEGQAFVVILDEPPQNDAPAALPGLVSRLRSEHHENVEVRQSFVHQSSDCVTLEFDSLSERPASMWNWIQASPSNVGLRRMDEADCRSVHAPLHPLLKTPHAPMTAATASPIFRVPIEAP